MTILRSLLFVPGNQPRRIDKALALAPDAVILDLEDACPVAEKVAARATVVEALQRPRACLGYVRINALTTPFAYGDLVSVVQPGVDGIMLTKVESPDALRTADWLISQLERDRGLPPGRIDLLPLVETARGFSALDAIARACGRVRRLAFGAGDFTVDMGITWSREETELLAFRSALALAARSADLEPPIDLAWIRLDDAEGFARSVEWGHTLGFQGKLCIHPNQIAPVEAAYTPTAEQVSRAARIVAAFSEAEANGIAAIQVDGLMVDYPIVHQAQRLLDRDERIRARPPRSP